MSDLPEPRANLPLEQRVIRARCFHPSGVCIELNRDDIEQSIVQRFERQVATFPQRVAVRSSNQTLTYEELNRTANRIARAVLSLRREGQEPVALLLEQSGTAAAAVLGVLKAGKIYVPLDPTYPRARLTAILEDCETGLILTDKKNLSVADELASTGCLLLDLNDLDGDLPATSSGLRISPDAVAAIFYTSGSTGQPKGVMQSHRSVLHRVMIDTNNFHICPDDRLSLFSSSIYSVSLRNFFGALLNGATLCPFNIEQKGLAPLADWLIEEKITIYFSVPTVFRRFIESLTGQEDFSSLRLIYLAGEGAAKRDVESYKKHFSPDCIFVNSLASNEAGIILQYFIEKETEIGESTVPAGYEVDGKEILLLDDAGQEVGCNQVGEIAVRSRYLSPGYWRKPELTAAAFQPDPQETDKRIFCTGDMGSMFPDGCLVHLGRKDSRVKIRGQGVEVAEVEIALQGHTAVKEAVVVARDDFHDEKQLVAYVVPSQEAAPAIQELRSFLQRKLPAYMIPSLFVLLESLPLTANGKIDRRALPPPGQTKTETRPGYVAPVKTVEHLLVHIWEELLGVLPIGIEDNFSDLGGDSLLASQMMRRIEEVCGERLPLAALLAGPTIKHLANVLVNQRVADGASLVVKVQSEGAKRPFFFLHGDYNGGGFYCLNLARGLGEDRPFYALAPHRPGERSTPQTVEGMAASYIEMMREIQPEGPYLLGGFCFAGTVAFEMARQLESRGQQIHLVALIGMEPIANTLRMSLRRLALRLYLRSRAYWLFFRQLRRPDQRHAEEGAQSNVDQRIPDDKGPAQDFGEFVLRVLGRYVPKPYLGRVALLWAAEDYLKYFKNQKDETVGWRRVAPQIEVHIVPGRHTTCITTHVKALADRLKACMERATVA